MDKNDVVLTLLAMVFVAVAFLCYLNYQTQKINMLALAENREIIINNYEMPAESAQRRGKRTP